MPHRKTLTSMENGLRTLNIASLNPDSMKEREMQHEIVKSLKKNEIHLAAIQETHITRDFSYMLGNYRIVTSAAEKSKETGTVPGGTAIIIRESLQQNITQIRRQSSRSLRVTLDHARSKCQSASYQHMRRTMDTRRTRKDSTGKMYKNYSTKHANNTS